MWVQSNAEKLQMDTSHKLHSREEMKIRNVQPIGKNEKEKEWEKGISVNHDL